MNYRFGIEDEAFIRGKVPMTKSEIRAVTVSKLNLLEDSHVLDIGCGTGSVTVECGLICTKGHITAIDQKEEAVSLTKANIRKFMLDNVEVKMGEAPHDLPKRSYDRIFIGGGSKQIEGIISYAHEYLKPGGILVANTILLESTYKILEALKKRFIDIECVMVQIAKGQQYPGWMMKAHNPIYVIRGKLKSQENHSIDNSDYV